MKPPHRAHGESGVLDSLKNPARQTTVDGVRLDDGQRSLGHVAIVLAARGSRLGSAFAAGMAICFGATAAFGGWDGDLLRRDSRLRRLAKTDRLMTGDWRLETGDWRLRIRVAVPLVGEALKIRGERLEHRFDRRLPLGLRRHVGRAVCKQIADRVDREGRIVRRTKGET